MCAVEEAKSKFTGTVLHGKAISIRWEPDSKQPPPPQPNVFVKVCRMLQKLAVVDAIDRSQHAPLAKCQCADQVVAVCAVKH
jgi:hypothetical protein